MSTQTIPEICCNISTKKYQDKSTENQQNNTERITKKIKYGSTKTSKRHQLMKAGRSVSKKNDKSTKYLTRNTKTDTTLAIEAG